jgi:lipopolysaccharide/colanic/teichoic acid biosynthesis glycosyltransferase
VSIRFADIFISFVGLIILLPFLIVIAIWIKLNSRGQLFYNQDRVGQGGVIFRLIKFRTMMDNSDSLGLLTIGNSDPRITGAGRLLRKYKIDELPQLINVLKGDMSLVGPRPEVPKYVELYSEAQKEILLFRPGITDYASVEYFNENELLVRSGNPEKTYIEEIMPQKIALNMKYLKDRSLKRYLTIIFKTFSRMFFGSSHQNN